MISTVEKVRRLEHDWHYCKMDMTHESIHSTTL